MKYNEAIEKIMPEVESGSNEPFIVYRDDAGEWHSDFTQNQSGEQYSWVDDIQDPFAVTLTGSDLAKGSFPYVYDKILTIRFRAEYETASFRDTDHNQLTAFINLLEENMGEFSHEVTDYLALFDRPLAAIYEMTSINLVSDNPDFYYDSDMVVEFAEAVESEVHNRLHNYIKQELEQSLAEIKSDKRIIEGYEEKTNIQLADKYIIFAENPTAAEPYLVCSLRHDNPLGTEEQYDMMITQDYLVAMCEFVSRVDVLLTTLETERSESSLAEMPKEQETPTNKADASALIAEYARIADISETKKVGSVILMPPLFDGGNFNRSGKKIRVTVEEPAGKYQLFSHEEHGEKNLYFLTASGRIDRTSEYFRDEWNEESHKRENIRPTETAFDEVLPQIAERFESDMENPIQWVKYQHAAVLNRLDECEVHNVSVRQFRQEENQRRQAETEQARQNEQQQKQEKYDIRVDEIAKTIETSGIINVGYNEHEFDGKNPVLDLFRLYGVDLPLRTQGWVNTALAEITQSGYRYYKGKNNSNSSVFNGYLNKLREAVKATPIEQKRNNFDIPAEKKVMETAENKPDLSFPDPAIGYSQMNLYGYTQNDMYPLTTDKAVELFDSDHTIYLLYSDNSEAIALDRNEIITFGSDGLCGIIHADWEISPVRAAQMAVTANSEGSREADLLYGNESKFGIYQIRENADESRNFRFASMQELEALGLTVDRANYSLVYTGDLTDSDTQTNLHKIYNDFNDGSRPADYTGRSVSVSDVIVLQESGNISSHFVDSAGFAELPSFLGEEKQNTPVVETSETLPQIDTKSEEYNGKTVAEFESDVKSGKAEQKPNGSLNSTPKAKPTLKERLEEGKRKAAAQGKNGMNKSTNKEVDE